MLQLACPFGTHISDVKFASFGTPTGECADLAAGSCDAPSAREIVADLCVGESACSVAASTEVFGDPCSKLKKSLAVQVECSGKCCTQPFAHTTLPQSHAVCLDAFYCVPNDLFSLNHVFHLPSCALPHAQLSALHSSKT